MGRFVAPPFTIGNSLADCQLPVHQGTSSFVHRSRIERNQAAEGGDNQHGDEHGVNRNSNDRSPDFRTAAFTIFSLPNGLTPKVACTRDLDSL